MCVKIRSANWRRNLLFKFVIVMCTVGPSSIALAQSSVVDLEVEMRKQNRKQPVDIAPAQVSQKLTTETTTAAPVEIEVQPKTDFRTVGNLGEPLRVLRGASEIGRSEFKVSCGIGVAYAFISNEEQPYRFENHKSCVQILKTESAVSKCRSVLRIDHKTKLVKVARTSCGLPGPSPDSQESTTDNTLESVRDAARRARESTSRRIGR